MDSVNRQMYASGSPLEALWRKLAGLVKPAIAERSPLGFEKKEDGWYPGICKMCMQGDCVIRVHVVDGVVIEVEGDKRAPNNQGTLCPRGISSIMNLYNPWRVKEPMKRTNPKKGLNEDPGWVEISWDEALQTVSDRLKKVHKEDPRKLVTYVGFGNINTMFQLDMFSIAFGTPNCFHTHGAACAYHFGTIYCQGAFPDSTIDFERTEYIVNFGRGFGANRGLSSTGTRTFLDAIERGVKIVNVDPYCSVEAGKSTEWVPIKPGTDCAFLLGMLYTVFYEIDRYDEWFVKNRTNGPYLIGPDGYYLRSKESNKPLMWDERQGGARAFDEMPSMDAALKGNYTVNGCKATPGFQLIKDAMKKYTPEWAENITTVPAKTIRRIAHEFLEHSHIGDITMIDGIPMPYRPVGINYERGAYQNTIVGVFGDLVSKILCELTGCLEVPGGVNSNASPSPYNLQPDKDGVVMVRGETQLDPWVWPPQSLQQEIFYPTAHTLAHIGANAILNPKAYFMDYKPEVFLVCGANPMHSAFDRNKWEKVFAEVPFSVCIAFTYDDTAVMADILLPDHSFIERDSYECTIGTYMSPHLAMEERTRNLKMFPRKDASAIRHPYNSRDPEDIINELAEKVGILRGEGGLLWMYNGFPLLLHSMELDINQYYTKRELAEALLKNTFKSPNMKLEDINDESGPYYSYPPTRAVNYNYYFWPENKTRHPMYLILLKQAADELQRRLRDAGLESIPGWEGKMDLWWKAWQPIPAWVDNDEFTAPAGYDLRAMNWKRHFPFKTGDTLGNPWLYEVISTCDPYEFAILINKKTAQNKGLKDGDTIIVESRYGKTKGRLKTTALIHPLALGIPDIHGIRSLQENPIIGEGVSFNALCSQNEADGVVDPITGGIDSHPAVTVYKA